MDTTYDDAVQALLDKLIDLPKDTSTIEVDYSAEKHVGCIDSVNIDDNNGKPIHTILDTGPIVEFLNTIVPSWNSPASHGKLSIDFNNSRIYLDHHQVVIHHQPTELKFPGEEEEQELSEEDFDELNTPFWDKWGDEDYGNSVDEDDDDDEDYCGLCNRKDSLCTCSIF